MNHIMTNRLADCLVAKRIRKSQLAHRFGLSRAHITRLVRGDSQPGFVLALRMAKFFGQPVEAIFQLVEPEPLSPASLGSVGKLTKNNTGTMKG